MGTAGDAHADKGCAKFLKLNRVQSLAYQDKSKWFQDMRQSLSLTASIIATITFQSAINPPGGVVPAPDGETPICFASNQTNIQICPGESVVALMKKKYYLGFLICNTICFISSLSVCLLLVSGLSLDNTSVTWFLLIGMCITITSLVVTYLFGAMMVTPEIIKNVGSAFAVIMIVWAAVFALVSFLLILRFVSSKNEKVKKHKEQETQEQELARV
ncbi:hypothetical protein HN51_007108 [Arachis hypogaea]|uniref:PGG domain-containing protein n=2 Tax=Arachis TaxID=3817 RepID=A0A445D9F6_ARAHY|nr:uncharacterized protein LOC107489631 [Arachis duranensis]XP_025699148.1 uncharacterized protein LOC112800910 [Arachis hypogaea]QHO41161.1 uncharacterized protein DS421_5g143340 [Arachis hypogaea]RYR59804.1 hypothetical protein Ahy_A05g025790 [Arachis hypogaea]